MNRRGMAFVEYCLLLGLVVVATLAMSTYVGRSVVGNQRKTLEDFSARYEYGSPQILGKGTTSEAITQVSRNFSSEVTQNNENITGLGEAEVVRTTINIYKDDISRTQNETVYY